MSLKIESKIENDTIIIRPRGEVDIYTSPQLKATTLSLIKDKNIVIDGEDLDYIDSTGLGALMSIYKKLQEKGLSITIINLKPNIYKLFDITGLNKVFNIRE